MPLITRRLRKPGSQEQPLSLGWHMFGEQQQQAATNPVNTPERAGEVLNLPAAAAVIYAGTLVAVDGDGYAKHAAATVGLRVIGRAEETVDNSGGSAGDLRINVKRGIFKFVNSSTAAVDADDIGKECYVEDNQTVAEMATGAIRAGIVVGLDDSAASVWVDTRGAAPLNSGRLAKHFVRAVFDPSATAGDRTIAAHTFGLYIPNGAIITGFFYQVNTTFTSATDAATVAFSVEAANDLLAAIAISDASNVLDAGIHAGKPGFPNFGADAAHDSQVEVAALFAATYVATTAARLVTATVAVEALTAGKATLFIEYVQGA